jgi:Cys-tRNA(Pro)/Cys-tRNA(Cys) deacylase
VEAVRAAGVRHTLHEYDHPARTGRERDARPSYGLETAAALGIEPERLLKTLVTLVDGAPVLAMVPVATELDLGALAAVIGGRRAEMADPVQAEKLTGYQVGGISPLGSRRTLQVVVDETVVLFDTVLCSAGRRGLQLELAPADLVRLTRATLANIGRAR